MKYRNVMTCCTLLIAGFVFSESAFAKKKVEFCNTLYAKKMVRGSSHRAFATTGGRSQNAPDMSCGWSMDYEIKKAAQVRALKECRAQAKLDGRTQKCKIIFSK